MSNIDRGFCTVEEYTAFEEQRCTEEEFQIDELYMMMFALKSRKINQQAAKMPSRITDVERQDAGLYLVKMTLLTSDLHPDCDTKALFRDGYRLKKGSPKLKVGGNIVKTAYMKTYSGALDNELQSIIEESLPPDPGQQIGQEMTAPSMA